MVTRRRNFLGRNLSSDRKPDSLTTERRSELMSKVKSRGTSFELMFFNTLKKSKINFIAHPKGIRGNPDIFIKNKNLLVFLDSDFWHGWQYPRWKHKLKDDFWRNKIERNRKRDRLVALFWRRKGYKVIRLWEHNIKYDLQACILRIKRERIGKRK